MTAPRRRHSRRHATPVPNLHFVTILVTAVLLTVILLAYAVVPTSKEGLYVGLAGTLVGFLTGKLSNGFGKSLSLTPTVEVAPDPTDDAEEQDDRDAAAPPP